jgi:hypothetical protein
MHTFCKTLLRLQKICFILIHRSTFQYFEVECVTNSQNNKTTKIFCWNKNILTGGGEKKNGKKESKEEGRQKGGQTKSSKKSETPEIVRRAREKSAPKIKIGGFFI